MILSDDLYGWVRAIIITNVVLWIILLWEWWRREDD